MTPLPTPRRLFDVLVSHPPAPSPSRDAPETVLGVEVMDLPEHELLALMALARGEVPPPGRSAAELALEAGSHRVYQPRAESVVLEARREGAPR